MITDYALSLIEKKKLQLWLKQEHVHCSADEVELSFRGDKVYAKCECGGTTNLSLGLHKDRRRFDR